MNSRNSTKIILFSALGPIIGLLLAGISDAEAQGNAISIRQKQAAVCNEQFDQIGAAIAAEDWRELERLGERYNKLCIGVFGAAEDVSGEEAIALANLGAANYRKALSVSIRCLTTYYLSTVFHIKKVNALIGLKRMAEAKSALIIAEKVVANRHGSVAEELAANPSSPKNRDLPQLLQLLEAQKEGLAATRELHFP